MGLLDFLSQDAGQQRRAWLDKKTSGLLDALQYYVGPGVDVHQVGGLLGMLNPVQDIGEAMGDARRGDYVGSAINTASALMPVAGAKLAGGGLADDAANVISDTLTNVGVKAQGVMDAGQRFAADEAGAVPLFGGGMSDPTQTGWTFRDVDTSLNRRLSSAENRRIDSDTSRIETLPIRELYAMQPTVNADFSTTNSSAGELPLVIRKDGRLFVRDGHHRITKAAEDGAQTVKSRFIDLDGRDTDTPLLDYEPNTARWTADDDALLAELTQPTGIRAYHSSPHDFDRFSMDARGYGVGDQAFGDGHYFSDNEPRALAYRERLKKPQIDGRSIYSSGLSDDAQELVWKFSREKGQGTLQDVANFAQEDLAARQSELPYSAVRAYNQIIEELGSMPDARITSPVKTYEVNINARPDEFLDWDAPSPSNPSATVGGEFRRREAAIGRANATRELAEQGYPGIAVKIGETGGKDYAVFDENLIEIVRKYGIAGAAAMLGVSASEVQAAMGQQQQPQGLFGSLAGVQ